MRICLYLRPSRLAPCSDSLAGYPFHRLASGHSQFSRGKLTTRGMMHYRLARLAPGEPVPLVHLSAEEAARMKSFGNVLRRRSFALGRDLLRRLLAEALGVAPSEAAVEIAPSGAIGVVGSSLYASLAHTSVGQEVLAAAAVADVPVGVDAEVVKPRHPDLYRRILQASEYRLIETIAPDRDRSIVTLWAVKEAVLKARRSGFRYSPRQLLIRVDAPNSAVVEAAGGGSWEVTWFDAHGCVIAVAVPAGARAATRLQPGTGAV